MNSVVFVIEAVSCLLSPAFQKVPSVICPGGELPIDKSQAGPEEFVDVNSQRKVNSIKYWVIFSVRLMLSAQKTSLGIFWTPSTV